MSRSKLKSEKTNGKNRVLSRPKFFKKRHLLFPALALLSVTFFFGYQIWKKPEEIFRVFDTNKKYTPTTTWQAYADEFNEYATKHLPPSFLAALSQAESAGNPWALPDWKFRWTLNLARIYSPASSSFGLMQITKGTFDIYKKFCVRDQKVQRAGSDILKGPCWTNFFKSRIWPSVSIDTTSAYLSHHISKLTKKYPTRKKSQILDLASVIHLCGLGKGQRFARSGYRPGSVKRCGSHSVRHYSLKIKNLVKKFEQLSQKYTRAPVKTQPALQKGNGFDIERSSVRLATKLPIKKLAKPDMSLASAP